MTCAARVRSCAGPPEVSLSRFNCSSGTHLCKRLRDTWEPSRIWFMRPMMRSGWRSRVPRGKTSGKLQATSANKLRYGRVELSAHHQDGTSNPLEDGHISFVLTLRTHQDEQQDSLWTVNIQ